MDKVPSSMIYSNYEVQEVSVNLLFYPDTVVEPCIMIIDYYIVTQGSFYVINVSALVLLSISG